MLIDILLASALLTAAHALAVAEDWPQFRGPTGQGHSAERGLPLEWSESQNVRLEDAGARAAGGRRRSSPAAASG